jgi:hypothetical protein
MTSQREGKLPPEWLEVWLERSTIMQHEAGLPPEKANAAALADTLERITRGEEIGVPCRCRVCAQEGSHDG